jgi:hypothetical protein
MSRLGFQKYCSLSKVINALLQTYMDLFSMNDICGLRSSRVFRVWVPVSSTGKVSCRQTRDLGSNPAYTKNQLMSWHDGKSNHHEQTP